MRLVIADPKTGKCYQTELAKDKETYILGKKIGETLDGNPLGAAGYTLTLTGGSDKSGFPMRGDFEGQRKGKLLLSSGPGFNPTLKGERKKKLVIGNTYTSEIMQVNTKVTEFGGTALDQLFPKKDGEKKK
ncbi:MAG: 30S ribosomal protein S6e [Candidatus Micrarchaeota archaeon]|nr:30S ribosomal protein S6e [Candidatus Micrarchaeota archaeon]